MSKIAYQKDPPKNSAVINDQEVSEGAMIEGAKIDKIYRDRVRFLLPGRIFEVPLTK